MNPRIIVYCACGLFFSLASCSSLPTDSGDSLVYTYQKQAADLLKQGNAALENRNYSSAEDYYRQAYEANARVDNLEGMSIANNSLGFLYLTVKNTQAALAAYEKALYCAQLAQKTDLVCRVYLQLARTKLETGDLKGAREYLTQAQTLGVLDQGAALSAQYYHTLGLVLRSENALDEALEAFKKAKDLNHSVKQLKEEAVNYYVLASLMFKTEQYDEALQYLDQALLLDKQTENSSGLAEDLFAFARVYVSKKDDPKARDYAWRSYESALADNNEDLVVRCLELLIQLDGRLGREADLSRWQANLQKLRTGAAKK